MFSRVWIICSVLEGVGRGASLAVEAAAVETGEAVAISVPGALLEASGVGLGVEEPVGAAEAVAAGGTAGISTLDKS